MSRDSQKLMVARLMDRAMNAARMFGDYEEAVQLFTQAVQIDPNSGEIFHNRGMAYRYLERLREALSDFTRAATLSPHPSSYEQRGMAYYQLGDKQAARRDWEQALRLNTRRTLALLNLGWLCIEEGRYSEAVNYCTQAISFEPTLAKAYENRARAYLEMGDKARGLADLQQVRELIESGSDTSDTALND